MNKLKILFKLLLATVLIFWLVRGGYFEPSVLKRLLNSWYVLGFIILFTVWAIFNSWRWSVLLRCQGFQISTFHLLPLTFIGALFNFTVPGGVSGDLVRAYYIVQRNAQDRLRAGMSIFMDRLLGLTGFIVLSFLILVIGWRKVVELPQLRPVAALIVLAFIGILGFFAVTFTPWFGRLKIARFNFVNNALQAIHSYRNSPHALLQAVFISILSHLAMVILFWITGKVMELQIPDSAYFFCIPIYLLLMSFPITPAGVGIGQTILVVLLTWYTGISSSAGTSLASGMQLMSACLCLPGLFFYLKIRASVPASKPANG